MQGRKGRRLCGLFCLYRLFCKRKFTYNTHEYDMDNLTTVFILAVYAGLFLGLVLIIEVLVLAVCRISRNFARHRPLD